MGGLLSYFCTKYLNIFVIPSPHNNDCGSKLEWKVTIFSQWYILWVSKMYIISCGIQQGNVHINTNEIIGDKYVTYTTHHLCISTVHCAICLFWWRYIICHHNLSLKGHCCILYQHHKYQLMYFCIKSSKVISYFNS